MSKAERASELYTILQGLGDKPKGKLEKAARDYTKFLDESSDALLKAFMKQGHTPNTAYYTMVKFVEKFYQSFGVFNPQVHLPKPDGQKGEKDHERNRESELKRGSEDL